MNSGRLCTQASCQYNLPAPQQAPQHPQTRPQPTQDVQLGSLTHHIFIHKCQPIHSLSRHLGVLREDKVHLTHPGEDNSMVLHRRL